MFNFSMSTRENFASFIDKETGRVVFVDSFDNHEFEVRFGTFAETTFIGSVYANSDEVLNRRLQELVEEKVLHGNKSSRSPSFGNQH